MLQCSMAVHAGDTRRDGCLLLASYPDSRSRLKWSFAECSPGDGDNQEADLDAGDAVAAIVQVPRKSRRATFHRQMTLPFDMIRDMREVGVEPFDAPGSEMTSEVVAMLRVEEAVYYDGIVSAQGPLSTVGKQLCEFFMWPKDFYEVEIQDVWRLEAGIRIQRCIGEHKVPAATALGQPRRVCEEEHNKPQDVLEPCFQTFALPAHLDDVQVEHLPSDGSDEMLGYPLRVALAMREGPARINSHKPIYINLYISIYIYTLISQASLALNRLR